MKYSTQMLLADSIEDVSSEDEIDELFSQLLHVEVPPTLVDNILASVARLPLPQEMHLQTQRSMEGLSAQRYEQSPS